MKKPIILLLTGLLCCQIYWAQDFNSAMEEVAQDNNLVGMSVITMCDGEIQNEYYYGLRNIASDLPVNENTVYRIASISKLVSATGLMKLYEDGLFELDESIDETMGIEIRNPSFPDTPITFEMVLSHTSSLQDGDGYSPFLGDTYSLSPPPNITELLLSDGTYFTNNMWRAEEPGTYFTYSNINYGLIGTLIEKLSGTRFDVFMKDQILEPLGISGSYYVNDLPEMEDLAVLYRNAIPQSDNFFGAYPEPFEDESYEIGTNGSIFAPQGGLRVSARDLFKIMAMHSYEGTFDGAEILSSSTIDLMHTPVWTYDGSNGDNYYNLFNQWGLGVQSTTNTSGGDIVIEDVVMYGHAGEAYGLISDMYFEKEDKFGIIFLTNGYYGTSGYSFGNNSAFYVPEEEIFALSKEYAYLPCSMNGIGYVNSPTEVKLSYNFVDHKLKIPSELQGGELKISTITGELISTKKVNDAELNLKDLNSGIYLLNMKKEQLSDTLKIVID